MHYAENECAMPIRLHCNELRALCLTTNALCRTAEFGALLLKCVLIVYIWPEKGVGGATPGTMPRVWPFSQVATTTAGERLRDRHMSGGRRPPGPANVGVTEDRRQVVWKIKQQLK